MKIFAITLAALTAGCAGDTLGGGPGPDPDAARGSSDAAAPGSRDGATGPLAPELGDGDHTAASVDLVDVSSPGDLVDPMDVEIDPVTGNLWVVNQGDNGWTIYPAGGGARLRFFDDSDHFLRHPAALAF